MKTYDPEDKASFPRKSDGALASVARAESHDVMFGQRYYIFLMVFLGALSAFGPFVTDFYLPTLPSMAEIFHTNASMVQLGLTASVLGIAAGQIIFGPVSDKFGRRPVLMASLALFCVSTIACIFSPTIDFFNICRFLQGLGGSGGIVMSRSVATDCYSGRDLAKTLAIVGAINGIAPVVAPVVGGLVADAIGWKGIFILLLVIGIVLGAMCLLFRESLPPEKRIAGGYAKVASGFAQLFRMPWFCLYVGMFGLCYGVLFAYISSASFIVQNHFGYSELVFSLVFGFNAIGSAIGSALTMKFRRMRNAALFSTAGLTIFSSLQIVSALWFDSFIVYESVTFMLLFSLGFIFPSGTTLGMTEGRRSVGAASAILGASGFAFGGLVSPLVGMGDMMVTSGCVMFVCSVFALTAAVIGARRKSFDV